MSPIARHLVLIFGFSHPAPSVLERSMFSMDCDRAIMNNDDKIRLSPSSPLVLSHLSFICR